MQAKRKEKMIKEINQIVEYEVKNFLPVLNKEVAEMQKKGFEVEIQYGFSNNVCTALLIGKKEGKASGSSNTIR